MAILLNLVKSSIHAAPSGLETVLVPLVASQVRLIVVAPSAARVVTAILLRRRIPWPILLTNIIARNVGVHALRTYKGLIVVRCCDVNVGQNSW